MEIPAKKRRLNNGEVAKDTEEEMEPQPGCSNVNKMDVEDADMEICSPAPSPVPMECSEGDTTNSMEMRPEFLNFLISFFCYSCMKPMNGDQVYMCMKSGKTVCVNCTPPSKTCNDCNRKCLNRHKTLEQMYNAYKKKSMKKNVHDVRK